VHVYVECAWRTETLLLATENVTVISQKKPINKALKSNILMCYVTDRSDMLPKCSPVVCNRISSIFLLNFLLCSVIDFDQYSY
jgi:hypothetical protein